MLGAGVIAHLRHVPGYAESGVARVVAVYDPVRESAERLAEVCGAVVCASPEELLKSDVDAVSVCSPNRYHLELTTAALRAGKHVLCEKPLGMTYAEAVAMELLAAETGLTTAVNFRYRYLPAVQLLKRHLGTGAYGRPYHLLFHYLQGTLIDPTVPASWRLSRTESGTGALGDLASHAFDLIRYLLGEVTAVFAELTTFVSRRPDRSGVDVAVDVDDAASVLLRLRNGAACTIVASRNAGGWSNSQRLELYGSGGSAFYEMDKQDVGSETLHTWRPGSSDYVDEFAPDDLPQSRMQVIADFARAADEHTHVTPRYTDGLRCKEIIEAAERSSARGTWVELPLGE